MPGTSITNSAGAFLTSTTFVSGVDVDGQMHEYGNYFFMIRANAVIARGQGLSWVAPTSSVPVSVTPMAVADTDIDFAGIAMESAPAGTYLRVCVLGFCLVWMNAQTAAAGETLVNPTTTAGELIRATTPTFDAALVSGTNLGRVFGIKNAVTNLALCYIKQF